MSLLTLFAAFVPCVQEFSAEELAEDAAVLREALETLHPGLERYNSPRELRAAWDELDAAFEDGASLAEAYLGVTRFLAKLRCGHTYANFWNQTEQLQAELFEQADKLPFTFEWIGERMVVLESTVPNLVPDGSEVLRVDGRASADLLRELVSLVSADGSNDGMRRRLLGVSGIGEFEAFDCLFALRYDVGESFSIELREPGGGVFRTREVPAVTRVERAKGLADLGRDGAVSIDELWEFRRLEGAAYLRLGSFVTWKMSLDWRAFLDEAFAELRADEVPCLILDVRGNGGGDNDVLDALLRHLAAASIELPVVRERLRYATVPEALRPYLDTWDDTFLDLSGLVEPAEDGFYRRAGSSDSTLTIPANPEAYAGRVLLLLDAANSSATFQLALALSGNERATSIGEETGGNRRGIHGGQIFFLRLPNTGIEVDVPLIAYFGAEGEPDSGLVPDVVVERTVEDVAADRDPVLDAALRIVRRGE